MSIPLLATGLGLYRMAQTRLSTLDSNDRLSVVVLAIILVWMGGFVLCYGIRGLQTGLFPFLFLFLMIPIPTFVLDRIVLALQTGSAGNDLCAF